ncbi:MAG: cupin domain-containing protein [Solirubrobacteraceae bacterium]
MPVIKAAARQGSSLEEAAHEATISLILDCSHPGQGPRLHRHPYDETWVIQEGNLTFQLGKDRIQAGAGDIVIAPSGVPHKFTNDGPGRSSLVCIHASPTIIGERLE